MKPFTLAIVFIIAANVGFAQSLWIIDPQTGKRAAGSIQDTKITYEPKGLFMQVDWEITFSAKGITAFTEKDTVEVEFRFTLPEGAVITDSWLWFGDSILKALILDRWSANQIYETIVKRRRDPSILYKNGTRDYELRIFPMAATETRKVKITFLTPAVWGTKTVSSPFLSEALLVSINPIETIEVFAKLAPEWKNPIIRGLNTLQFNVGVTTQNTTTHQQIIGFKQLAPGQMLEIKSPLQNGPYLSYFEKGNDKFYQLAALPVEGLNLRKPQKVLFLFDFQKENSTFTQAEMLYQFSGIMSNLLTEKDSFNILYYNLDLQKASEKWIAGDSLSIATAISKLGKEPFASYGNLPSLLASGIKYAQSVSAGSKFILIANSNKLDNTETANKLISDLMKLMSPVFPVYIADFQTNNYRGYWVGNIRYNGNEYFYRNLAKLTGGDYCSTFDGSSFSDCINKIYHSASSENGMIDIHTTLKNGFCYGRYFLSGQAENAFSNAPYLEIGRYSGDFPFEVEISGVYAGDIFFNNLSISKTSALKSDSVLATFWYGNKILELETSGYSYSMINDIIDKSISNRILSNYTAFLCLEPGMLWMLDNIDNKTVLNRGFENDAIFTSAEQIEIQKPNVKVYPNPFKDQVNIEIQLPEGVFVENVQMEIYDLFGKRIKVFNVEEFNGDSEIKINWDATDVSGSRLPKGTYIFVCTTPEGRISKKLIVM